MKGQKGEFNSASILTHPAKKMGCSASPPTAFYQAQALGCTLDRRSLEEGTKARLDLPPETPISVLPP